MPRVGYNLMSNILPHSRVKIMHCLGYGLPVPYILLFAATFYLLNAAMGIMREKFGPICNISLVSAHQIKDFGSLLFILHEIILAYFVISSYQGLLGQRSI